MIIDSSFHVKKVTALIGCLTGFFFSLTATSQSKITYPERAIRLIVPFSAGGTADVLARLVSEELFKRWGKPAVVVNKDGADTILGVDLAAKSNSDGHTILIGSAAMAINTGLGRRLPYDLSRDLEPITLALMQPLVLVASPNSPISTIADLVRIAKNDPDSIRYGSLGTGGIPNMAMQLLRLNAGIDIIHVPYKGSPAALIDVMGGQIQLMFSGITSVANHIKLGRLRGVAITSKTRSAIISEVPTIAESGFPGYQATSWYGMLVKTGTSKVIVRKLNEELKDILSMQPIRRKMSDQGGEVIMTSNEQFGQFLKEEIKKWADVTQKQKIHID